MNQPDDELARKDRPARSIAAWTNLDAGTRERLAAARRLALSRHRERPRAGVRPGVGHERGISRERAASLRRALPASPSRALVLALIGVAYWQTTAPDSDFADIDVEPAHRRSADQCLPRQGLRFMAKTFVALIVWLCIAFPAAAAQSKTDTKKPVRPAWSELTPAQQQVLAPLQAEWEQLDAHAAQEMGRDRRALSQDEAGGAAAAAEAHAGVGASSRRTERKAARETATRRCRSCRPRSGRK